MRPEAFLTELGHRLSQARHQQNLTMAEVSERASVSTRYLRMAEAGQANLSILKLASLARALRLPLRQLCDLELGGAPELRIALLGVRGAGKTTVGRSLSQRLEVPFFELDQLVEERAGMPLGQVFTIHGEDYYRELQREALEAWLTQNGSGVIATGGSIVNDPVVFDRLRSTCRTIWLRATADAHWSRVLDQGDMRPMRNNPRARSELQTLLESRRPSYETADLCVDTTDSPPGDVVTRIADWVTG